MRSKLETEKEKAVAIKKHKFLMFLIKKASGAISSKEFELFKNM
jgi:hypothetical protein